MCCLSCLLSEKPSTAIKTAPSDALMQNAGFSELDTFKTPNPYAKFGTSHAEHPTAPANGGILDSYVIEHRTSELSVLAHSFPKMKKKTEALSKPSIASNTLIKDSKASSLQNQQSPVPISQDTTKADIHLLSPTSALSDFSV